MEFRKNIRSRTTCGGCRDRSTRIIVFEEDTFTLLKILQIFFFTSLFKLFSSYFSTNLVRNLKFSLFFFSSALFLVTSYPTAHIYLYTEVVYTLLRTNIKRRQREESSMKIQRKQILIKNTFQTTFHKNKRSIFKVRVSHGKSYSRSNLISTKTSLRLLFHLCMIKLLPNLKCNDRPVAFFFFSTTFPTFITRAPTFNVLPINY